MAQFLSKPFGMTPNGEKINEYIISNPGGAGESEFPIGNPNSEICNTIAARCLKRSG